MNSLTDFIQYELYPSLFERIDVAFPELDFQRRGGDWQSSKKLNGEPASEHRLDKTVITRRVPSCIHEQGGETLSLVDYQLQRSGHRPGAKGAELIEALRYLAGVCGLVLPEGDSEEYRAYQERQERLARFARKMKDELFSEAGKETLDYLLNVRKYEEDFIRYANLGFCSEDTARKLEEAPYGAGSLYPLVFPFQNGGRILGFKFRALSDSVKPKYKNSNGLPKKANLFGLTGLKLTGKGDKDRDIYIAEGELDALYAQYKGVENIVSSTGVEGITLEALEEARRRGVKRATIIVDYEKTEAEREEKKSIIEKAIRTIHQAGLASLVAILPAGEPGEKVDVDSYLHTHSKDELQSILDGALSGARYLFSQIHDKALVRQGGEGRIITDKYFNDYKEDTITLLNDVEIVSPVDREIILTDFSRTVSGAGITKETLQEEADRRKAFADKQRQEKETQNLLKRAESLASSGRTDEALLVLKEGASKISKISREAELSSLLSLPSRQNILDTLKNRPQGVKTKYYFSSGKQKERLILPTGAITLVCAPPSHGKSTFIRNLALQIAQDGEPGTVLYFTYEEDYDSTLYELVNTYAGLELTTPSEDYNNLTTIAEYYRDGSTRFIKTEARESFKQREATFFKDILETGKLRIYDEDAYSDELVEDIAYLAHNLKVKAVFIDYVQLLYKQGNKLQRNEELKEIAKDFRQLAIKEKLPIVLTGQLNRQASSPTDMYNQNIADSADLEREANKVILLWNSAFRPGIGNNYDKDKTSIEESKRKALGELGTPGKVYARLSKNRGGVPNLDAVYTFKGNTGEVVPNDSIYKDFPEDEEEGGYDI